MSSVFPPAPASAASSPASLRESPARAGLVTFGLLILVAVEGWYKRTNFATDAISYLDISRALGRHDWKMVFNPLWSPGYPALLALVRPLFADTPAGEWLAIHVLNLVVFLAAWCAFLYLLRAFDPLLATYPPPEARYRRRLLHAAATATFVAIQLCIDSVARVGPDLLVTLCFFLATGLLLRLLREPGSRRAALLGLTLAFGYWVKGIFFPLSLVFLAIAAAGLLLQRRSAWPALAAAGVFALGAAPCVAGLSWSYGHLTTGESGNLNYAFHVNYLPRWTNWQGSQGYGSPIHPTHQILHDPDLFVFGEPFHNTYPPFGNIVYWYQGYRHFFSLRNQAIGAGRDLVYLVQILRSEPIFYAVALSALLLVFADRRTVLRSMLRLWPLYLAALLGILLYVQVHLEDRYLGGFLTVLCLAPFVAAMLYGRLPRAGLGVAVCAVMGLGAVLNCVLVDRDVLIHLRHHFTYARDPQWILGTDLPRMGLHPGEAVGVVGGPNAQCTWAYIARVRIVAELGGGPYDQLHPYTGPAEPEVHAFWSAPPAEQRHILALFYQAGAAAVVAPITPSDKPPTQTEPGWQHAPGTDSWVYRYGTR